MVIRRYAEQLRSLLAVIDLSSIFIAFYFAGYLRFGWQGFNPDWTRPLPNLSMDLIIIALIWPLILHSFGLYKSRFVWKYSAEILNIMKSLAILAAIIFTAMYLFKIKDLSRLVLGYFFLFVFIFTIISRSAIRYILSYARWHGYNYRNVLIVGAGRRGQLFAENLKSSPHLGYKILGYLDDGFSKNTNINNIQCLGSLEDIEDVLKGNVVDEIVVALPYASFDKIKETIALCEEQGKTVRILMDFIHLKIAKGMVNDFNGLPILSLIPVPHEVLKITFKRVFDIFFSFFVLLVTSPFLLTVAIIIKLTSAGPVFFKQERVGLNGRTFLVYKFRSMVIDAENQLDKLKHLNEQSGPVFKIKDDPRVTRIGKFMRKTSLDELPQFINVLIGDMSVVGPRPPLPKEVRQYDAWHRRRLSVKPGITCIWQVSGRNNIPFEQWMEMDMEYIDNWSLGLDMKLIWRTCLTMIGMSGQ